MTFSIYINSFTAFRIEAFIDTPTILETFTASNYVYEGLAEGSSEIDVESIFETFYDNKFGSSWRVMNEDAIDTGHRFVVRIYQRVSSSTTSSGSYIEFYLPPNV